jgi:hypothetical protein
VLVYRKCIEEAVKLYSKQSGGRDKKNYETRNTDKNSYFGGYISA